MGTLKGTLVDPFTGTLRYPQFSETPILDVDGAFGLQGLERSGAESEGRPGGKMEYPRFQKQAETQETQRV